VLKEYPAKCHYHRSVSQLGYKHLHPVTPSTSTSGETSPASQVFPKGMVVRVLLVHCQALNPEFAPVPTIGSQKISILDGFSEYNQIMVHLDEQEKKTFTTPWGTFMYAKIPFELMNAGETFQRAMDIAFVDEKDKFIVIYLDDITVYLGSDEEHLKHLRRTFEKCRKFSISLNPEKSNFGMEEGKLLGHIISKEGIKIDPNRVEEILKIGTPRSKK
jgi:hypothetical protein